MTWIRRRADAAVEAFDSRSSNFIPDFQLVLFNSVTDQQLHIRSSNKLVQNMSVHDQDCTGASPSQYFTANEDCADLIPHRPPYRARLIYNNRRDYSEVNQRLMEILGDLNMTVTEEEQTEIRTSGNRRFLEFESRETLIEAIRRSWREFGGGGNVPVPVITILLPPLSAQEQESPSSIQSLASGETQSRVPLFRSTPTEPNSNGALESSRNPGNTSSTSTSPTKARPPSGENSNTESSLRFSHLCEDLIGDIDRSRIEESSPESSFSRLFRETHVSPNTNLRRHHPCHNLYLLDENAETERRSAARLSSSFSDSGETTAPLNTDFAALFNCRDFQRDEACNRSECSYLHSNQRSAQSRDADESLASGEDTQLVHGLDLNGNSQLAGSSGIDVLINVNDGAVAGPSRFAGNSNPEFNYPIGEDDRRRMETIDRMLDNFKIYLQEEEYDYDEEEDDLYSESDTQ